MFARRAVPRRSRTAGCARRAFGVALLAGGLAGCAAERLYLGAARPSSEVALVVTGGGAPVKVEAIDEVRVSSSAGRYEVLPGRHVLGLRLPEAGQASVTIEAEAGHAYRLRASQDAASSKWTPRVDDAGPLHGLATPPLVSDLERGCHAGTAPDCVELGALYERGTADLGWDEARAAILYKQACNAGFAAGCFDLGRLSESGRGVMKDEGLAASLYEQACGSAEPRACTRLGVLLEGGRGARKNARRASELFEKACGDGDPAACSQLGALAREGRGGSADFGRAAAMYEKACAGGEAQGCTGLGLLYEDGLGVEQDERRAAELYAKACEGGSALGCANLGVFYQLGLGVARDGDRAAALFKQGCAKGAAPACAGLAPAPEPVEPPAEPPEAAAPSAGSCGQYLLVGSHIPLRICPEAPKLAITNLMLGARGEVDLLQRGYAAALWAESSGDGWSVAATAILRLPPGGRLEARLHPLQVGPVRPYLGLGASIVFPAVAGRAALGVDVRFSRLHLLSEVALERFFNAGPTFEPNSVLFSVGAGWQL